MMPPQVRAPFIPRMARPILPQDRGAIEKMIDYIVGEGPNNRWKKSSWFHYESYLLWNAFSFTKVRFVSCRICRYALICKKCSSHNGMALQEEFEFLAFQCCYCFHFNPARRQRPTAPILPGISAANSTTSLHEISRSKFPPQAETSEKTPASESVRTCQSSSPNDTTSEENSPQSIKAQLNSRSLTSQGPSDGHTSVRLKLWAKLIYTSLMNK